jgi:hypothetical protein
VAGCCEYGDEPSGSGAKDLVVVWECWSSATHRDAAIQSVTP